MGLSPKKGNWINFVTADVSQKATGLLVNMVFFLHFSSLFNIMKGHVTCHVTIGMSPCIGAFYGPKYTTVVRCPSAHWRLIGIFKSLGCGLLHEH